MEKKPETHEEDPKVIPEEFVATHPTNPNSPMTVNLRLWEDNKMTANGWQRASKKEDTKKEEEHTHKK